jgi:hypothetical protein
MKKLALIFTGLFLSTQLTLASSRTTEVALNLWNTNTYIAGVDLLRVLGIIFVISSLVYVVVKISNTDKLQNESAIISIFSIVQILLLFLLLNINPILANGVLLIINIALIVIEPILKIQLPDKTKQPVLGFGVSMVVVHIAILSRTIEAIFTG